MEAKKWNYWSFKKKIIDSSKWIWILLFDSETTTTLKNWETLTTTQQMDDDNVLFAFKIYSSLWKSVKTFGKENIEVAISMDNIGSTLNHLGSQSESLEYWVLYLIILGFEEWWWKCYDENQKDVIPQWIWVPERSNICMAWLIL